MAHASTRRGRSDPALSRFRSRLRSMSDRHELLADLMGFGPYTEMALTRDGTLVAKPRRTRGQGSGGGESLRYDTFLGPIEARDRARTAQLWAELTEHERAIVLRRLFDQGIEPERIGIVVHQHYHSSRGTTAERLHTSSPHPSAPHP